MVIIPFFIYFATQAIESEMQIQYEFQHKTFNRFPIIAIATVKFLSMIAFIPLLLKYKLYSATPVILAQIADLIGWLYYMTPDRAAKDRTYISKLQIYADIVYSIFCLPTLHFYRLYFVFVYMSVAVVLNFILVHFM